MTAPEFLTLLDRYDDLHHQEVAAYLKALDAPKPEKPKHWARHFKAKHGRLELRKLILEEVGFTPEMIGRVNILGNYFAAEKSRGHCAVCGDRGGVRGRHLTYVDVVNGDEMLNPLLVNTTVDFERLKKMYAGGQIQLRCKKHVGKHI